MMRTAAIRLEVSAEQAAALSGLRSAYADACNALVPLAREHRLWNRVGLHRIGYRALRNASALGSQMCCNAIFTVCKAYKAQKQRGRTKKDAPVPQIRFDRASVHFDKRTCALRGEHLSLYTLAGRITVSLRPGAHQQRILACGQPKERPGDGRGCR
jgi:hypothetical protein